MCLPRFKHKPGRFERTERRKRQAPRPRPRPRPHQPRPRQCLLKGCERWFRPRRASERYCSPKCRQEARKWSQWKAQQKYRKTLAGREKRKGQSQRYRERVRNRSQAAPEESPPGGARVITGKIFDHSCDRPGCYAGFERQPRSPAQRFCSHACRRAMERVWQRERRWRLAMQQQWRR
jgi:predicted nucleic acid-binding Zn ribbon protein